MWHLKSVTWESPLDRRADAHGVAQRARTTMSRKELAQRVAELLYAVNTKRYPITGHYIAKLERGAVWWPCEEYRAALCLILGASNDAELGFRPPESRRPAPPGYVG
ncbi:hypothetical protein [Kribbella swartbergensis]